MQRKHSAHFTGFTWVELLVTIAIVAAVFFLLSTLSLSELPGPPARVHATQMLSNMRMLHLATQQMALDGTTTGEL